MEDSPAKTNDSFLTDPGDLFPGGVLSFTDDGIIQTVNATLRTLLGYKPGELEEQPFTSLLSAGGRVFYQTHLFPTLKLHGKLEEIYLSLRTRDGEEVPVLLHAVRYPENSENPANNECLFVTMRQRSQFEDELLRAKRAAEEAYKALTAAHHKLELQQEELQTQQEQLLELNTSLRSRAEREQLVNAVGSGITNLSDPEAILQSAVTTLGQGLHADRCYYMRYNLATDTAQIGTEWHQDGLEPIRGNEFQLSTQAIDSGSLNHWTNNTHIVFDTAAFSPDNAETMRLLGVGALVRASLQVGNEMTALGVSSYAPRAWTEDEVHVIESVAAQLQPALNIARLQQREHNIAVQLQDALIPPAPKSLPGMKLASFYRPALQEAGVGGDFFDVFGVEKACTALVVADLSGKGLHAASEVATCRNMIRYALYAAVSIAEAVTSLNDLLVEHKLLSGFATAFLGMYDHTERTLTYVNCGQEPGLLWRASTGEIEELLPTGAVLGGFGGGSYRQATVNLLPGDVLALFTDGMTEVGPNRQELLEVEGIRRLLLQSCAMVPEGGHDPYSLLGGLISDVDTFGLGGIGDDIAMLIGVVN